MELLSLWGKIVRWRPDVLVYLAAARGLAAARRDAAFFRLCGIRTMIGISDSPEMQEHRWLPESDGLEPEAARLARNITALGDADLDNPASWDLHLTEAEQARADEALASVEGLPLIAVSVGTKQQVKDWGRENWRELLSRISEEYPGHALVLCGAADEQEASRFAAEGWRTGQTVNLCGTLTPRESAAVFSRAQLFLGHDSGPMHLAAAVQTPCIAIFSARNKPRVWFPYGRDHRVLYHKVDCWGCNLETCVVEKKRCIASISVDEVLSQVSLLKGVLRDPTQNGKQISA